MNENKFSFSMQAALNLYTLLGEQQENLRRMDPKLLQKLSEEAKDQKEKEDNER